jgi:hypothetical protein
LVMDYCFSFTSDFSLDNDNLISTKRFCFKEKII